MAVVKLQKVHVIGMLNDKSKVLSALQDLSIMQIEEINDESLKNWENILEPDHNLELKIANLEFAITLLKPYAKKRSLLEGGLSITPKKAKSLAENFEHESTVKICKDLEVTLSNAITTIELLNKAESELTPWKHSKIAPKEVLETNSYAVLFTIVNKGKFQDFKKELETIGVLTDIEIVKKDKINNYITIIFNKNYINPIKELFSRLKIKEINLPEVTSSIKEALHNIKEQKKDANKTIHEIKNELKKLAANYETLQVTHDYYKWQLDTHNMSAKSIDSVATFAFSGWLPVKNLTETENLLRDKTNNKIALIPVETDEVSPVLLKNNKFIEPLEHVTKLYGMPIPTELDPTALLSIFFLSFFGLALTDAGYGIVMIISMLLAMKFIKMDRLTKLFAKLLLFGGMFTLVMGVLYGGWFGITIDQAPDFLKTIDPNGKEKFILQIFNPIENPMSVLILSIILGYIQTVVGITISFYAKIKSGEMKTAILDHGTWLLTLLAIGVTIAGSANIVNTTIGNIGLYTLYFGLATLVLTQGRAKSNIIAKLLSGVLSLYNLVGYFGDILSYSRLLALGLATSIIGLAINVVAGLAAGMPYIGWLLAIIVIIGGHIFNLIVNALGAFIHSARLQYVEYFSKFFEGGGLEFRPFKRDSKYTAMEDTNL